MSGDVALAAPHPAAVEAGRAAVAAGGNALDAALAAAAALTVVYPHQCSIGGDLTAVVRPAGGGARAVLSLGAAAAAIDVDALRAGGATAMPERGPSTVTVPGVVAGWAAVAALGARLGWAERLRPAIALARDGAPVSAGLARAIRGGRAVIDADPGLSAVFGDAREGTLLTQPALAGSLRELAGDWNDLYTGPLGLRLAAGLRRLGSPLTAADLAAHRAETTDPLTAYAHGAEWAAAPPPSQGATFLAVLGSDRRLAAAWRARSARDALLGDPRTGPVDLPGLLLRDARPAHPVAPGRRPTGDTVAVTAVGADGTAVSLIQSVFDSFGAGLLEPDTGIVLHSRGSMFSLDPAHPGRLAPGSRPPHTLCPTVAVAGDTVVALGCQGGLSQPWILAQVAADALTAADPAELVRRPRWIIDGGDRPRLVLEPGVPGADGLAAEAASLGLAVTTTAAPHDRAGHVQLARLRDGVPDAGSDPRADGIAAVF
ncbi:gamma-glutamyltransferase [Amorphoplanes digitatis]|uniref:Gamma-glutamyltranspeptidase n=1 Tax=Actinoplanes digitatis TaxID=1868 RepID=A0A7W7HZX2_9ACTN|nr:gamma-glutamyltransferase [Actinoplanes digitatis]MBB4763839.1 gamma-glutamyltranspeptidase [Actinoplanes digitatis]GID95681.1 gamma-glutamyltranspeptidase [Actinoplanes digitatis]